MNDAPDKIRPFIFHGCDLESIGNKKHKGDCPLCAKTGKFFVDETTGQWDCKSCQATGNIHSFLAKLYEDSVAGTTEKDLEPMAKDRKIPASWLKECGLAKSVIDDTLLLPGHNTKGKLANLYRVVKERGTGKWLVLSTPGCKLHPFLTNRLTKAHKTIWVCEGPWDAMALSYALSQVAEKKGGGFVKTTDPKAALHKSHGAFGIPGAGNFNPEWADYLSGKVALLCFDNDHPRVVCRKCKVKRPKSKKTCECGSKDTTGQVLQAGWQGTTRACKIIAESGKQPKSLHRLKWGEDGFDPARASGYDMRDLINETSPIKAIETAYKLFEHVNLDAEAEDKDGDGETYIEPLERDSFKQLCKDFETTLHFTQPLRDTLAVMLAVTISTDLKGDQLWLRVIGPPGSGKTTLAECLSVAKEYVYAKSIFTGFHSGFTGGGPHVSKKDASLIPLINKKTFCIKEGDNLLTAPNRDRILSELRDLYDGTSRTAYRNRISRNYESIQTTLIVCGTDSLRGLNRSSLGDRFIDCEIFGSQSSEPFLDRALKNTFDIVTGSLRDKQTESEATSSDKMLFLKRATYGYVKFLKENLHTLPIPTLHEKYHKQIKSLGQFLSYVRARGHRDDKDAGYRPRVELATRLVSQFTKLAICLALIQGKSAIDDEIMDLLRKVVIDTATSYHLEIVQMLARYPNGVGKKEIAFELKMAEESVRMAMWDMQRFGVVTRKEEPNRSGIRGRNLHIWCLSETFRNLMDVAFNGNKTKPKPHTSHKKGSPVVSKRSTQVSRKKAPIPRSARSAR